MADKVAPMDDGDRFHEHLDKCRQCNKQVFNLCTEGLRLLTEAAKSVESQMFRGLLQWNTVVGKQQ